MHSLFYDTHWIIISNAIRFKIDASIVGIVIERWIESFFFFFKKKIKVTLACNCREIDANYPL